MRITDIRCYVVADEHPAVPFRWRKGLPGSGDGTALTDRPKSAILRMDTDEGIIGALKIGDGEAVASLTRRRLKSLIGEDPMMTERLWTRIWEIDRIEEMNMAHLGLIDLLAWDIKSRKANLPLYQLLGGNNPQTQVYASTVTWDTMEEYERHIKECRDEGFSAFKLHAWGDDREDAKLCRNLRRWTGDDAVLMFDGSAGWDLVTSLRFGRVLEEEGFYWYEEPMREFNLTAYRKLADGLDIPVLAAETSDGVHWNAATWIDAGALDMIRTSTFYKGGVTGALKDRPPCRVTRDQGASARYGIAERPSLRRNSKQRFLRAARVLDRTHQGAQVAKRTADHCRRNNDPSRPWPRPRYRLEDAFENRAGCHLSDLRARGLGNAKCGTP